MRFLDVRHVGKGLKWLILSVQLSHKVFVRSAKNLIQLLFYVKILKLNFVSLLTHRTLNIAINAKMDTSGRKVFVMLMHNA